MTEERRSESDGKHEQHKGTDSLILYAVIFVAFALLAFNQYMIFQISGSLDNAKASSASNQLGLGGGLSGGSGGAVALSQEEVLNKIIPRGVPRVYGPELGVSFEDPVGSLPKLAALDKSITLSGEKLERYIKVGLQISCEYCCGAEAIIFKNGEAACGCQHSYAMRGLAKYLLQNHASEFSDAEILAELGKWKTLFFPKQILQKALVFQSKGMALDVTDLTSNKYRGFEKQQTTQGGAAGGASNLPNMVGGC